MATKSDLLNINNNTNWSWIVGDGTKTSIKIHTLQEHIDKFLKFKEIKKKRASTIDSYRYALNKFAGSVGSSHLIQDTNEEHIDNFIEDMEKHNLSLSSIDSYLKGVCTFLRWCELRKYIEKAPIIELFNPILDDKWLIELEYNAILDYEGYTDRRFPKMFKLYGETGMRLSEGFYGVLTEDDNGIWLAIPNEASKSKKGRTIQLNVEQRDTIRLIQTLWMDSGSTKDHIKYYSKIFMQVRDELGISKHKSFHSLRHYFGKSMVTITGNIYKVSGLMGHSSVKVTEDNYVKGFDRKSTLRDFPSLRKYLITPKNKQNKGVGTQDRVHKYDGLAN